jgi:hypothetical protein
MILRKSLPRKLWCDVPPYRPYNGTLKVSRDKYGKMNLNKDDIQALKSHVAFICVHRGKDFSAIGTAFLLSVTEYNHVFDYWVTCKHVVKPYLDNREKLFLRINESNKTVAYVPMNGEWCFHKDITVDLAMLNWNPPDNLPAYEINAIEAMSIYINPLIWKKAPYEDRVREGNEVFLLGLFPKYYGDNRNLPTFRFGNVSLLTTEKTPGEYGYTDHYFIECDVWKGSSGSPVYVSIVDIESRKLLNDLADRGQELPDESAYFYGVASEFYPHRATVKSKSRKGGKEPIVNEVVTHYGISLVIPSYKVGEMLYGDTMVKKRKKKIDEINEKNKPEPASVELDTDSDSEEVLTKEGFEDVLKKISRPIKPKKKVSPKKKGT